ncbi:Transcription initiation factor IIF subunit beta [Schizosaccharomyces pombe]|uniref:Transcription initiation factor IIF subunit beta n=1 Tax=Schizosaccharomyces pombe (strain 972 / ATCC 24843) TaxID=284812 RepID=T2FB_SCHPO|nr:putative transcription factor TFIIF complex beta subunit Tfg2 [Schizosaccharomyces pombe]O94424.1 RecName: Full=Transcription initiation factor IIF subunit beta; AltName: Full=TFIIF medium subunit; AltName: Full=TFIIF-beta [Schizosaccharomyces pombe 972h-]CAB91188.1 transcription factor TFIIF complex beta subunit Tfg2 (predicted) [Schizosaccharomyces pombe]|eukprot:NP_595082.1 putative transcription factor TFIIF complex beta subunit Tfg2 [Schizosaccharomyces pombe]
MSEEKPTVRTEEDDRYEDDAGDLDLGQIGSRVWLVKIPKFLMDKWNSIPEDDAANLGCVRVKNDEIQLLLQNSPENADVPKIYNLRVMNKFVRNSYVFRESETSSSMKSTALVGTVAHECNVSPVINDDYRRVMQKRALAASAPKRKVQMIDDRGGSLLAPGTLGSRSRSTTSFIRNVKPRTGEGLKNSRIPRNELLDILFKCFEDYEYWTLKGLREYVKQPEVYLKEVLDSIAILNKRGPYALKYSLKPEYKGTMDAASVELRNQQASQSESSSIDHTGKNTSPDNPGTNAEEDEDDDGVEMIDVV